VHTRRRGNVNSIQNTEDTSEDDGEVTQADILDIIV
jgi:hypothetical protein